MKKKKIILLFIMLLFLPLSVAKASPVYHGFNQNYTNKCTVDHTCMLLCGYTNTVRYTYEGVTPPGYDNFSSYIYYDFTNNSFFVEWLSQESDIQIATHNVKLSSGENLFFEKDAKNNLKSVGKCPANSHIDVNGFGFASEVCFGDSDDYCSDSSNAGTTFKGDSKIEYNYETHVKTYFEEWFPTLNYSCEEFRNLKVNIEDDFVTDFSKNFLYSNKIPKFLENSESYKSGLEKIRTRIADLKEKCDAEVNNNDKLTEEEKEALLEKNKTAEKSLNGQLEEATERISNAGTYAPNVINQNCESLLGDPTDGKSPAYYLTVAFKVVRYAAIVLLIVLTVMDFIGAVASQDNDIMKKVFNKAITRMILCVIIFLLPMIIEFILTLLNDRAVDICINTD